jgi:hypothetical protein
MPSSLVGCQSIGAIRSSNLDEWPSFHLRKTVQRMARPPTEAATTMSTVVIVLFFPTEVSDCGAGTLLVPAASATTEFVLVTVDFSWDEVSVGGASGVSGAGVGWAAAGVVVVEVDVEVELTEATEAEAEAEALTEALLDALTEAADTEADAETDVAGAETESTTAEADADADADADAELAMALALSESVGFGAKFTMGPPEGS